MLSALNTFPSFDAPSCDVCMEHACYSKGSKGNLACNSGNIVCATRVYSLLICQRFKGGR